MRRPSILRTVSTLAVAALITGCAFAPSPPGSVDRTAREDALAAAHPPDPTPTLARPRVDVASWYGEWHQGRPTASGEPFDTAALTAAHRSLPLGTCVEVTNLANGRRVFVRVNDRGPYITGRTIDLSQRAAEELAMTDQGLARVRIRRAQSEACEA
jgi:rare lipoprotein A